MLEKKLEIYHWTMPTDKEDMTRHEATGRQIKAPSNQSNERKLTMVEIN